jgi:hypothetical protein
MRVPVGEVLEIRQVRHVGQVAARPDGVDVHLPGLRRNFTLVTYVVKRLTAGSPRCGLSPGHSVIVKIYAARPNQVNTSSAC